MKFKKMFLLSGITLGLVTFTQCEKGNHPTHGKEQTVALNDEDLPQEEQTVSEEPVKKMLVKRAFARFHPLEEGSIRIQGFITFRKVPEGVKIVARLHGLNPGSHGLHIHEYGNCEGDGTQAGGHYNPYGKRHGSPDDKQRHVGDLGNVIADAQGNAYFERIDTVVRLNGPRSIVGKSVIIHALEDDYKTQPTGNSLGKIACGIIEEGRLSDHPEQSPAL